MVEILTELRNIEKGLEVRVSLLNESAAQFFVKDQEKLRALIEALSRSKGEV